MTATVSRHPCLILNSTPTEEHVHHHHHTDYEQQSCASYEGLALASASDECCLSTTESKEQKCNLVAFFLFGVLNNFSYVVMLAGAKEISNGGTALSYIFSVVPSLLVKFIGPFVFHLISYRTRVWLSAVLMATSFTIVALGNIWSSLALQLIGVTLVGFQSGIGEASFLALASFYDSRRCITAWSSGTGVAGLAGYGWICLFLRVVHVPFSTALFIANLAALAWLGVFHFVLDHSPLAPHCPPSRETIPCVVKVMENNKVLAEEPKTTTTLRSTRSRATFIVQNLLFPYMIPLLIVYCSEYAMQSGTWAAIGFPLTRQDARDSFYFYANFSYQLGVFISRSSGTVFQANRAALWTMPMLQVGLLILFSFISLHQFWYSWAHLIPLTFFAGLLGGGVYVNAFTLMARELSPVHLEFSLGAVAFADSLGILLGDGLGLFLQCRIYEYHGIPGAQIQC